MAALSFSAAAWRGSAARTARSAAMVPRWRGSTSRTTPLLAWATGGRYYRAQAPEDLAAFYAERPWAAACNVLGLAVALADRLDTLAGIHHNIGFHKPKNVMIW